MLGLVVLTLGLLTWWEPVWSLPADRALVDHRLNVELAATRSRRRKGTAADLDGGLMVMVTPSQSRRP
jgi:hypothetical protein